LKPATLAKTFLLSRFKGGKKVEAPNHQALHNGTIFQMRGSFRHWK
jgi:hypothetical protein